MIGLEKTIHAPSAATLRRERDRQSLLRERRVEQWRANSSDNDGLARARVWPPEVMKFERVLRPEPGPGEVHFMLEHVRPSPKGKIVIAVGAK